MKFLIIVLLLVLTLFLYLMHSKENFFSEGPKLVKENDIIKLTNPNPNHFTVSIAVPIPINTSNIIKLGNNVVVETKLDLDTTQLNLVLKLDNTILIEILKFYKKSEIEDNIINRKLYNLAIVYNKDKVNLYFEDEVKQVTLPENIRDVFSKIDSMTYLFTGGLLQYEFSPEAKDEGYICNQNNTCKLNCTFMSKNINENMGDSPESCYINCISDNSCSNDECFKLCKNPNTRLWKPVNARCEFKEPFGNTKIECVKTCLDLGPNCSNLTLGG